MTGSAQRYIGGAAGFAFAAVWATAGIGSALVCVVAAVIGYAAVRLSEGRQLTSISAGRAAVRELQTRRSESADRPAPTPTTPKPKSARPKAARAPQQTRPHQRVPARAIVDPEPATYGW
jgi:hypothetical protein